jgi:hypothetical protein
LRLKVFDATYIISKIINNKHITKNKIDFILFKVLKSISTNQQFKILFYKMNNEIQFTRYLYEKDEVKLSLLLCILNKKEESIFWAYELYYSGFKKEMINLFWSMYYDFYYTLNPSFEKYLLNKFKNNLDFEANSENCISMIVHNFMIRPHSMDIFMLKQIVCMCDFDTNDTNLNSILDNEDFMILSSFILSEINDEDIDDIFCQVIDYFNKKSLQLDKKRIISEYKKILDNQYQTINRRVIILARIIHYFVLTKNIKLGKNIYVHIEPEDVIIYETIYSDLNIRPYKILPLASIYYIDQYNYLSLFHLKREQNDIKNIYRDKWLYHASFSPLWKERILKYNGNIDQHNKAVIFDESEDFEEEFYNEFGYEPDEQKIETQSKSIQEIKKERTWISFYNEHKKNDIIDIDHDILNDMDKVTYIMY